MRSRPAKRSEAPSIRTLMRRFHEPIGMMIFCHQLLYEQLGNTIWYLSGANQAAGEAIASQIMSVETRIDLFSQLADLRFRGESSEKRRAQISERVKAIVKEMDEVNQERNRIVHGRWMGVPTDTLRITKYSTRAATLKWGSHEYIPNEIGKIATRIWNVNRRLRVFHAFVARENAKRHARRMAT
jgi:hypothetical protein